MRLLILLFPIAAIVVLLVPPDHDDVTPERPGTAPIHDEPPCPKPRVTELSARVAGRDGYRVNVRVEAEVVRGSIGALHVVFRKRSAAILDVFGRRRASVATPYTYHRPGTYRISAVAESSTGRCRLKRSEPARLRVPVPLSRPRGPSFP